MATSAWWAFPASAPSSSTWPSSSRRTSRRSFRSTRAGPTACSAASAKNTRAASSTCSATWSAISPPCINSAEVVAKAEADLKKIKVPFYTGSGWYGYTYKTHLNGAQNYFAGADAPKKLMFTGPAHLERPFRSFHHEILKWYDHWLKGLDTGAMREPPVKFWVMGENKWHHADNWPLPQTQWTRLYLRNWERLSAEPFVAGSVDAFTPPDAFVQMPPSQANTVQKLRYLSEPLPEDVLIAGPSVLTLFAEIDQDDTNWIVALKDVGPYVSVMSVREGERELPKDLPEREVTRGWLKASHRALDETRSKPWRPWHKLT